SYRAHEKSRQHAQRLSGEISALNERLQPKIDAHLDQKSSGVQVVETQLRMIPPTPGPLTKYVQIIVCSKTDAPLVDCEARLTNVVRLEDDGTEREILSEQVLCVWSGS